MDAADDRDVKLQRASGDLVKEFSAKLPSLLWKPQSDGATRVPRRRTPVAKTEKLVNLLEPFQEWPQLLDPHLQSLLPPLVDAFLGYLIKYRNQHVYYGATEQHQALYPLPRAICRLLYTFCKVRGAKVISRFLNNEPKYLDPLLRAFIEWDTAHQEDASAIILGDASRRLIWEERYVMLTWLSHLLLAPFDLASISSDDIPIPYENLDQINPLPTQTPTVSKSLLSVALNYVNVSGKEREAATALLARLVLRRDMQALGLLRTLTDWAFSIIQPAGLTEPPSVYTCIGVLSFLARLGASCQVEDFAALIIPVFERTMHVAESGSDVSKTIKSSALARKMIIKILRTVTVMALALSERGDGLLPDDKVSSILEDAIDNFLVALADKDTPVRFAASKALSIITLKLEPEMATEVIEAVTGSLEENILFEKQDGTLVTPLDARMLGESSLKRNLSAVDAQRWQGLILTLGHLLFRRAPPIQQLPDVLQPLVSGLDFEQRSSTGSSVGTGVRDASCFGIWALSRKYTTQELLALTPQKINTPTNQNGANVLQMLATELVCAACVDPSGNIRRGSSAALQELIGRHPNIVVEGIPLVQVVDYHAVARRSRAMIDVAKATVALSQHYWSPLIESLMHWRGIGSIDAESRRQAATAIGVLSTQDSYRSLATVLQRLRFKLSSLPHGDVEARHGCFLALSATVDAFNTLRTTASGGESHPELGDVVDQVKELWNIFNSPEGPNKDDLTLQVSRPELTSEAASCLIRALSISTSYAISARQTPPSPVLLDIACSTLLLCISRAEDIAIETSSGAISEIFPLLSSEERSRTIQVLWSHIYASRKLPTARGQISALGSIFRKCQVGGALRQNIVDELIRCADKDELIEKRVMAVKSLATGVLPYMGVTDTIADHLISFLNDYTTDRRGDIGSLVRLEAIQAARIVLERNTTRATGWVQAMVGCLCRLAAEKLDKVRLHAWLCLQSFWESTADFPPLRRKYEHFSHVSSTGYFLQLLELRTIEWLCIPLYQGLATSAVAGAEGLIRASRSALVQNINSYEAGQRQVAVTTIISTLLVILSDNLQDDRYAIPVMELLAFLLDGYISSIPECLEPRLVSPKFSDRDQLDNSGLSFRKLFVVVQKGHFKSTNVARLEAAVRTYATLSRLPPLRADVLKKMTTMLLHPFPR
ncbi:hypothetical protein FE257_007328 [Aspergillus nanangensis]|uniref:Tubulin-specific chaperone D n=1 Tax=Aspergillus nanangensis TaxID=2582783 RepID=A0AAD4CMZ0_ASPNN|nr:hypothetical protein FE257_007328 [Aspergillus nanangensis]